MGAAGDWNWLGSLGFLKLLHVSLVRGAVSVIGGMVAFTVRALDVFVHDAFGVNVAM